MRVEHLELRLDIVDLILGLYGVAEYVELNESTGLLSYVDHLRDHAEVREDVVDAHIREVLWNRSDK